MRFVNSINYCLLFALLFSWGLGLRAQSSDDSTNPWNFIPEATIINTEDKVRQIIPKKYQTFQLDQNQLQTILQDAAVRFSPASELSETVLTLPMPDGGFEQFKIVKASVMHPNLAARYPMIQSYAGQGIDDPSATIRFDVTQHGFHAMVLTGKSSSIFIDPYAKGDTKNYISYYKKDYERPGGNNFTCHVENTIIDSETAPVATTAPQGDCRLRTYRLALAVVGEYTQFHGGTVPLAMAAMVTAMTRINGIYERDLAISMIMVENNDQLVFVNPASDPYTNSSNDLGANNQTCNSVIGSNNYDIGHLFTTGGGGVAFLNSPCTNNKGRGLSGQGDPIGDPFTVDYVSHEMGHQFGANHTQNNSCNRVDFAAMEPGSASTIMGYAGICAPNVQFNSDDHFHAISIQEIALNVNSGASSGCPTTFDLNNTPPVIEEGANYSLPVSTPFTLTATATDDDGDALTYCWEQMDPQVAPMPPQSSSTSGPAFRSFSPAASPARTFPNLSDLLNNIDPEWEELPAVSRNMRFRCTVRDNAFTGGCTVEDDVVLSFSEASGPFLVLNPNTELTWNAGDFATINWDVANTDQFPVDCAEVTILLSTDGGLTYPITIAENIPNNGNYLAIVPNQPGTQNRIKVVCADNIFFDVSNTNFTIVAPTEPGIALYVDPPTQRFCSNTESIEFTIKLNPTAGFTGMSEMGIIGLSAAIDFSFSPSNQLMPPGEVTLVINNPSELPAGNNSIEITATSGNIVGSKITEFEVIPDVPAATTLVSPSNHSNSLDLFVPLMWSTADYTDFSEVQIATNPDFATGSIIETAVVEGNTYTPQNLEDFIVYYWRVIPQNLCGSNPNASFWNFQTVNTFCTKHKSTEVLSIPENQVGVFSSSIMVDEVDNILDLNANLLIQHSDINQLIGELIAPNDSRFSLFIKPGGGSDGCANAVNVTFDDEAMNTAVDFKNTCNSGSYQPNDFFEPLVGLTSAGEWILEITDITPQAGGSVLSWDVEICAEASNQISISLTNQIFPVPQGMMESISMDYLAVSSVGMDASELEFTITSLPTYGTIQFDGQARNIGFNFTQEDINNGSLSYQHDGSDNFADGFRFNVVNEEGSWLPNNYFSIVIYGDALVAVPFIDQQATCFGATNGVITINAFGGTPPYIFGLAGTTLSNQNTFSALPPNTYTFEIEDVLGATYTITDVVVSNPDPIIASNTVDGNEVTIDASGGTGFLTYSLDGNDYQLDNIFESLESGDFTAYIQDENGCVATTDFQILSTAIFTPENNFAFKILPNPNSGSFILSLQNPTSQVIALNIYDMVGRLLHTQSLDQGNAEGNYAIDLNSLGSGVYFLNIKGDNITGTQRLILIK